MLGSTFLLAQAHAPDAPQQENSYQDSSVALANSTPVPTCAQPSSGDMAIASHLPETSTSERVSSKQQAELDEVATEVIFLHAQSSRIYKQGMVHKPLRHSSNLGVVSEVVQQAVGFLVSIGQVQAADGLHQAASYKDPSSACPNSKPTAKSPSAAAGPLCELKCQACGSVAKAMPAHEAARLLQRTRDTCGVALECMDRLKNGGSFLSKDGSPLPPHISGWHKDYFVNFKPSEESKRKHEEMNVWEMRAILEKETEELVKKHKLFIYELQCSCAKQRKYLCDIQDRKALGLERANTTCTKFQDRAHVSKGFWGMFAAIEWEDHCVGSKRKKTT